MVYMRREAYPQDVTRIQQAIIYEGKLDCSRNAAATVWREYSDSLYAGWIMIDGYSPTDIWRLCEPFIIVEDE